MNKSVSEMSKELKVTPQAIYKILKTNEFKKCLINDDNGLMLINPAGQALLHSRFNDILNDVDNELTTRLKDLTEELRQERDRNIKLTDEVFKLSSQLIELTQTSQRLLENEQKLKAMKKGFFTTIKQKLLGE